jgi:hypothetical protein
MNPSRILLAALAAGVCLAAIAQKPEEQAFKDKAGRLKLWNMTSHEIRFQTKGPLLFEGTGKPVLGRSEAQGLDLKAARVKAELEPAPGGAYLLRSADLRGGVEVDQKTSTLSRSLRSASAKMIDAASGATIDLDTPFTYTQTAEGRTLDLKANQAQILTDSLRGRKAELRSAKAGGNVQLDVKNSEGSAKVTSPALTYTAQGANAALSLPSPFVLIGEQRPPAGGRRDFDVRADQGDALINSSPKKDESVIISLSLKGSVKIIVVDDRPAQGEAKAEKRVITASAPQLAYSRETGKLVLSGGVDYDIDITRPEEEPLGGSGRSQVLEISLSPKWDILDYLARSGEATLRQGDKP